MYIFQLVLWICAIAACCYYLAACVAAFLWLADARRQRALPAFTPPVTILKPLRGAEAESYATLASFCRLDYPSYQIVFGVKDPRDAVIPIVEKLRADFPHCDIALVVNETVHGYNGKVSNLQNALPSAKHDVLLIADSDIRVAPDYLRRVVAPLQDPQVGMVTCLYRGISAKTFGDLLENIGLASLFAPEVLTARMLQGVKFALGAGVVMRRATLEAIGGFTAIADHLADDYELGYRVATQLRSVVSSVYEKNANGVVGQVPNLPHNSEVARAVGQVENLPHSALAVNPGKNRANLQVILSDCVVDHVANAATLGEMFQHQLRWMRAIRVSRPAGYVGLIVTYGTVTASLALLVNGFSSWAWRLWFVTLALRMLAAFVAGFVALRDRTLLKWFWLVLLRDVLAFVVWLLGFWGNEIEWRGVRMRVLRDGKLTPIKE
ncbi:MAG: glycosyltransferase [Acidobacteria bacterium]|nr:glycosyltransferase [Acidobacteriota bacterium]